MYYLRYNLTTFIIPNSTKCTSNFHWLVFLVPELDDVEAAGDIDEASMKFREVHGGHDLLEFPKMYNQG